MKHNDHEQSRIDHFDREGILEPSQLGTKLQQLILQHDARTKNIIITVNSCHDPYNALHSSMV
jgi:Tfp pilus assembly PilM family ATPase